MGHERLVTDSAGVAWEVYREDDDSLGAVLEWGHRAPGGELALIFSSTLGLRRLRPAPAHWESLSDADLVALIASASPLY